MPKSYFNACDFLTQRRQLAGHLLVCDFSFSLDADCIDGLDQSGCVTLVSNIVSKVTFNLNYTDQLYQK